MKKYNIIIFKRKKETQVIKLNPKIKCPSSRTKYYLMNTCFKRDILKF